MWLGTWETAESFHTTSWSSCFAVPYVVRACFASQPRTTDQAVTFEPTLDGIEATVALITQTFK